MHTEARKIQIIQEVLKIESEATLDKLESFLRKRKKAKAKKNISDFVGVLSPKEAQQMEQAIKDTCETIDENDWK